MVSNDDFSQIEALDFDAIKQKLMHRNGGQGWDPERAEVAEREYKRFLYLMKKFPNERTAPLVDVDTFWHQHILDTKKYAADCQCVFGYFLHHFPYAGMRGKEDELALERMGERMRAIYEETFCEDYFASLSVGGGQPRTALSSGVRLATAFGDQQRMNTAYCFSPSQTSAYCFATAESPPANNGMTALRQRQSARSAYCFADAEPATTMIRLPEERTGFYLDRPALP